MKRKKSKWDLYDWKVLPDADIILEKEEESS